MSEPAVMTVHVNKVPYTVTINAVGEFSAVVFGVTYAAHTLATLRKKLTDAQKLRALTLPVTRQRGNADDGFEDVDVVGLAPRQYLVRGAKGAEFLTSTYGTWFRRLSLSERLEIVRLREVAARAEDALNTYIDERTINPETEFRRLLASPPTA